MIGATSLVLYVIGKIIISGEIHNKNYCITKKDNPFLFRMALCGAILGGFAFIALTFYSFYLWFLNSTQK